MAYIEWRSSGDVVVKLLACGTIRSGVWFLISPRRFQRLVISCFQLAILPKYRYFKAAQTKQPTNVEWNMNILVNTIAWSSIANDNRFSALCKHYLILPHISRQRSIIFKKCNVSSINLVKRVLSAPLRFTTGRCILFPNHQWQNIYLSIEVPFFVCIGKWKDTGHL